MPLEPDSYLTDGRRLFRIVSSPDGHRVARLEDCMTLEIEMFTVEELWDMWLRHVRREAAAAV